MFGEGFRAFVSDWDKVTATVRRLFPSTIGLVNDCTIFLKKELDFALMCNQTSSLKVSTTKKRLVC